MATITAMDKARAAWAAWGGAPDWVLLLAEECDRTSLRRTAERLDASPAIISLALLRRRGSLAWIRTRVERELAPGGIDCPILGEIGRGDCLREQATPFSSANPVRVRLYAACQNCKHRKQ
jgi:hypothetical protein